MERLPTANGKVFRKIGTGRCASIPADIHLEIGRPQEVDDRHQDGPVPGLDDDLETTALAGSSVKMR